MTAKIVKVVVLGLAGVGKSALSVKFALGNFVADYEPTISNNYKKNVKIDGENYQLDILDTAGMEGGETVKPTLFRGRDCFVLVFDITDRSSFEAVPQIHEDILRICEKSTIPCCVIGNKVDLEADRQISKEEGEKLAKELDSVYIEGSARTGQNVENAIIRSVKEYLKTLPKENKSNGICLLI